MPAQAPKPFSSGWTRSTRRVASIADGTLAPAIVSQNTAARMASMRGKPNTRLVSHRSSARSSRPPFLPAPVSTHAPAMRVASRWSFSASASWKPGRSVQRWRVADLRMRARPSGLPAGPPLPPSRPISPERTASATRSSALRSRSATQRALGSSGNSAATSGSMASTAASTAAGCDRIRCGRFLRAPVATSAAARSSASIPSPRRATVGTTGTPSSPSSRSASTETPCRRASSTRLRQTTTRSVISRICRTRLRLRSSRMASTTTTVTSGSPKRRKSRATSSSALPACSE